MSSKSRIAFDFTVDVMPDDSVAGFRLGGPACATVPLLGKGWHAA